MTRKKICQTDQVPTNTVKGFDLNESKRILIINANDTFYASQGMCPHQEVCLEEGLFDGEVLTCHQHLWQWKIATGEPIGLAEMPLEVYTVEVEENTVYIHDV